VVVDVCPKPAPHSLGITLRVLHEQGLEATEAAEQVPSITYPVDGEALDVVTGERRRPD
jgi:hypothetical protein